MKISNGLLASAILGMTLSTSVNAQPLHTNRPTPPDSFLKFKVYSVDELVREASSDNRIRRRYANFFHVPESRVIDYMRANLVASYVPETRPYTVYCARPDGTVYPVKQVFRRGTKVFALRNGQPVMKWACGNPLAHFLPAVEVKRVPVTHTIVKVGHAIEVNTPTETDVLVPSEVDTPVYKPAVPALVSPPAPASRMIFLPQSTRIPLWPLLLPIPFAFTHGHSSSSPVGGLPGGTTGATTGSTTGATTGTTTGSTTGTSTTGTSTTGTTTGSTTGTSTTGGTTTGGTSTGSTTGVTTGTTSTGSTTGGTSTGTTSTGSSTGITTGETSGGTSGITTGTTTGFTTGSSTGSTTGTEAVPEPGAVSYLITIPIAAFCVRRKRLTNVRKRG